MVYEGRLRPEPLRLAPWVAGQWARIARALDTLEAASPAGPPTMGQIALGCALGHVDFRLGARDWRAGRSWLAAWEAAFAPRPAMLATRPVGQARHPTPRDGVGSCDCKVATPGNLRQTGAAALCSLDLEPILV